jgi:hypothetical protein
MAADKPTLAERWPVVAACTEALDWLKVQTDLGLAPRTIEAYARVKGTPYVYLRCRDCRARDARERYYRMPEIHEAEKRRARKRPHPPALPTPERNSDNWLTWLVFELARQSGNRLSFLRPAKSGLINEQVGAGHRSTGGGRSFGQIVPGRCVWHSPLPYLQA